MDALKFLSEFQHLCHLGVELHWLSFLIQLRFPDSWYDEVLSFVSGTLWILCYEIVGLVQSYSV